MKPFPVHCETCGARLKVRDEHAIGEIHACPKCDSMVLIAPPASWGMAAGAASASLPPAHAMPPSGLIAPTDFAGEVDALLQPPLPPPTQALEPPPTEALEPPPVLESTVVESSPGEPSPAAPSEAEPVASAVGGRSSMLVWGVAGVAACFAIGLMGAAWWSQSGDQPETTNVAQETSDSQPVPVETTAKPSEPVSVSTAKPAVEEGAPQPIAEVPPVVDQPLVPALPSLPTVPTPQEASNDAAKTQATSGDNLERQIVKPALPPLDPLAIDSTNLDLLLTPELNAAPTPPVEAASDEPEAAPTDEPRIAAAPQLERRFEPGSARQGPYLAENFAEEALASRLSATVAAVEWSATPLDQAFADLSQLSGVPVTIDPAALQMAAVAARHPVTLAKQDATVDQIASALATAARLQAVTDGGGLRLAKEGADRVRTIDYKMDDLLSPRERDAAGVAQLIRTFVAPPSWSEAGGGSIAVKDKTLAITAQAGVQYEILLFCERLRKARGLATRSRYPKPLIHVEPRLATLHPRLARPTTFAFVDWTPLAEVFTYWQETSGVTVLVDWAALADQDQRPLSTLAASVNNVPWSEAFDAMLHPLELDWTPVDGRTVQVTTRGAATNTAWVEFYPPADVEALRQQIEQARDEADLATFAIEPDPSGKFVIVRGNRRVHEAVGSASRSE